jgi:SAM-dependent methyltransferase
MSAEQLCNFVRDKPSRPLHVLNFGSGPAIDIQLAAEQLGLDDCRRLRISLLDLDPRALERAQTLLAPSFSSVNLRCERENLFRIPQRKAAADCLGDVDFLVCPGLFDYLSRADAAAMLAQFWQALQPGGQILVFHFGPANASRAYMEWIGNWYLIYRDRAELHEIAAAAGIPRHAVSIGREATGASLYWDIRKD